MPAPCVILIRLFLNNLLVAKRSCPSDSLLAFQRGSESEQRMAKVRTGLVEFIEVASQPSYCHAK